MSGEAFLTITPCCCTSIGELRKGNRHPVLNLYLGDVKIGADLEGNGQSEIAGVGRLARHVEHVFHAVDLFFDRRSDRLGHGFGIGPGIGRTDGHGGRHDFRVLRHRQRHGGDRARDNRDDRNDHREDRTIDKEMRNLHGRASVVGWVAGLATGSICGSCAAII